MQDKVSSLKTKLFLYKRQVSELKEMQSSETCVLLKENKILNEKLIEYRVANFGLKERLRERRILVK